jgi:hypothetical protein
LNNVYGFTARGQGYQRQFTALPATTVWHLAVTLLELPVAEHTWPHATAQEHSSIEDDGTDDEDEASTAKVSRPHHSLDSAQQPLQCGDEDRMDEDDCLESTY